ncbi:MAG: hypothetical protein GY940_43040 [bacterium]|nr:hypothetical protein [bacterium]
MNNSTSVLIFSIILVVVIVIVFAVYIATEKKKRKTITNNFRVFSENYKAGRENLRTVPRVSVPDTLDVILTLTDNDYFGLKARALDMSLSGFSVKPDFPLKRLPVNALIKNVLVVTPINTFAVKEMKTVRIDHHIEKRLMAFHIHQIDEDQFDFLKQFMSYLDEFLKKSAEENES